MFWKSSGKSLCDHTSQLQCKNIWDTKVVGYILLHLSICTKPVPKKKRSQKFDVVLILDTVICYHFCNKRASFASLYPFSFAVSRISIFDRSCRRSLQWSRAPQHHGYLRVSSWTDLRLLQSGWYENFHLWLLGINLSLTLSP